MTVLSALNWTCKAVNMNYETYIENVENPSCVQYGILYFLCIQF